MLGKFEFDPEEFLNPKKKEEKVLFKKEEINIHMKMMDHIRGNYYANANK